MAEGMGLGELISKNPELVKAALTAFQGLTASGESAERRRETPPPRERKQSDRSILLSGLRPYLNEERRKSLEVVLSCLQVLEQAQAQTKGREES